MAKDNYTLEELTDLLHTQVVLTLINDGEFYRHAQGCIIRCDYRSFCELMTSRIRAVAGNEVPDVDFMPTCRSRVLIWDYYMREVQGKANTSNQYAEDMNRIEHNNRDMLSWPKTQQDPGVGFVLITPEQARDLKFTAEYYSTLFCGWKSCRDCIYAPGYAYRVPAHVMKNISPALSTSPSTSPSTSKEITMSTATNSFDASVPVTNITLIYGKPAKNYSEGDLLACVRRLDADIETYLKSGTGSARIAAKIATMKAERDQIILAFDAAGDTVVGTTSDAAAV